MMEDAPILDLRIQRVDEGLDAPAHAKPGDAGMDLRSAVDITIGPGQRCMIPCGLRMAIPEGFAGLVIPRSGLAAWHGITIVNAPGLIDSGYRGDIQVILLNTDAEDAFTINKGDRIAQLVIIQVPEVHIIDTDALDETSRGDAGFGSSGR